MPNVRVICIVLAVMALAPVTLAQSQFGEGVQVVGVDIAPGTYRALPGSGCYWARLSGFGGTLDEIIANDNALGPTVVTISPSDRGFDSRRCGVWTDDLSPITAAADEGFGDGTFIVGIDISPGTWRTPAGTQCYWARLRGFGGSLDDIIANDNARGSAVVTIQPSDQGFTSRRCGTWTKI